jgi:hypothetical protein
MAFAKAGSEGGDVASELVSEGLVIEFVPPDFHGQTAKRAKQPGPYTSVVVSKVSLSLRAIVFLAKTGVFRAQGPDSIRREQVPLRL